MKSLLTLFSTVLVLNTGMSQITERSASLSVGDQNAFTMDHEGAEKKMVEKALEEVIKEYGKVKRNKKAKEWTCLQCKVSAVSSDPVNIYYKVEEGKGMVTSILFFDDGTKFISSDNDSDASKAIERINMNVKYNIETRVISKELEKEEDNLKDFEKELSKLEKKNKDLHEDIEDYNKKIKEAEAEIEKNLQSQEDKKMQIEKQKNTVSDVTDKLNNVGRGN